MTYDQTETTERPSTGMSCPALWPSDWGWAGEEIQGCLPFQAERSRPGSVSMTKADRQPAMMHKTWARKVGFNRANYLFFFFVWGNMRVCNRMSESALWQHHVNQAAISTPLTGNGASPGIATLHRGCDLKKYWRKSIPGNDIDWNVTLLDGANCKTNTFRQACSQTTVQSTKIQQLCMNSDRAKDLFWFKPYGSHLRGNFWHPFEGPGFDVEIGTAQSFGRRETIPR